MDPKLFAPLLIVALVLWGIYRRARRSFGRQAVVRGRLWGRLVMLALVVVLVGAGALHDARALIGLGAGLGCGLLLAAVGLRYAQFESTPEGHFYTPHAMIGAVLMAVLVGRIGWRVLRVYAAAPAALSSPQGLGTIDPHNPVTLGLFGGLVGYYAAFNLGVLRRSSAMPPATSTPQP